MINERLPHAHTHVGNRLQKCLGERATWLSPLGFGAFKIGRNVAIKYPSPYDLPSEIAVQALLDKLVAAGIRWIDTAPAYGLSEERLGRHRACDPGIAVISTKVGERFEEGISRYDFSTEGIRESLDQSRRRLKRDILDIVFLHVPAEDLKILEQTSAVEMLQAAKNRGEIHAIGLSGKTVAAAQHAIAWADILMVEYHALDRSHDHVMREATRAGVTVVVKKALASGHLPPEYALREALTHPSVTSVVVGTLNWDHLRSNWETSQLAIRDRGTI